MHITAEIMQTYDLLKFAIPDDLTALRNFKFLVKTQHEVPFINTSEATNKSSDPTENGKCTYVTNSRISKSCRLDTSFAEINSLTTLPCSSFCTFFLLSKWIFRESKSFLYAFVRILHFANLCMKTNLFPWER